MTERTIRMRATRVKRVLLKVKEGRHQARLRPAKAGLLARYFLPVDDAIVAADVAERSLRGGSRCTQPQPVEVEPVFNVPDDLHAAVIAETRRGEQRRRQTVHLTVHIGGRWHGAYGGSVTVDEIA